ncbi:MAG: hypothetical protein LBN09_03685 [Clostridioides sp.]|nr:hypothetical protein [Clostridioides sp.]
MNNWDKRDRFEEFFREKEYKDESLEWLIKNFMEQFKSQVLADEYNEIEYKINWLTDNYICVYMLDITPWVRDDIERSLQLVGVAVIEKLDKDSYIIRDVDVQRKRLNYYQEYENEKWKVRFTF